MYHHISCKHVRYRPTCRMLSPWSQRTGHNPRNAISRSPLRVHKKEFLRCLALCHCHLFVAISCQLWMERHLCNLHFSVCRALNQTQKRFRATRRGRLRRIAIPRSVNCLIMVRDQDFSPNIITLHKSELKSRSEFSECHNDCRLAVVTIEIPMLQ